MRGRELRQYPWRRAGSSPLRGARAYLGNSSDVTAPGLPDPRAPPPPAGGARRRGPDPGRGATGAQAAAPGRAGGDGTAPAPGLEPPTGVGVPRRTGRGAGGRARVARRRAARARFRTSRVWRSGCTNPDGSPGDLLLASTGWGRLTRFVLTPSRTTYGRPMTTLLPYRTAAGRSCSAPAPTQPASWSWRARSAADRGARSPSSPISEQDAPDPTISFDPVINQVPGLEQYPRRRAPAGAGVLVRTAFARDPVTDHPRQRARPTRTRPGRPVSACDGR